MVPALSSHLAANERHCHLIVLLLILWYCHKRGREVRLEREAANIEEEIARSTDDDGEEIRRAAEATSLPATPLSAETKQGKS